MSGPLSPCSPAALNSASSIPMSPITDQMYQSSSIEKGPEISKITSPSGSPGVKRSSPASSKVPSSPFQTDVTDNFRFKESQAITEKENLVPVEEFKIFDEEAVNDTQISTIKFSPQKQSKSQSPSRRLSPKKVYGDETLSRPREQIFNEPPRSVTPANDDLTNTINLDESDDHDAPSMVSDDTRFSTFSAVPNADMTMFANLRTPPNENTIRSPSRRIEHGQTPTHGAFFTPGTSRKNRGTSTNQSSSPSPTPKQQKNKLLESDTTNLLLDFTQQFGEHSRQTHPSPTRRGLSPTKTEPNLLAHINNQRIPSPSKSSVTMNTPGGKRNVLNLLDFDLPPQPTPRSVPTITIRELESLKSTYLTEISSLKANLSGKEAEVESLKKAVSDAERRVGEALEKEREERNAREHAEREKTEWEKKGQEVECVLQNVREEFVFAEKEKEELLQKLEESNRLREEAELRADECTTKVNVAQSEVGLPSEANRDENVVSEELVAQRVAQQLDEKMENLARELHAVYKKKHESKVATLKKTYEIRSEKKCSELQQKIEDLTKQNEDLQASKDATFSGELPCSLVANENVDRQQQFESQNAELQEQRAKLAGLTEEMNSLRNSHEQLVKELEKERIEKGELVAAVDEMLALQSEVGAPSAVVEDFRKSIGRPPSSLKAPSGSLKQPTGLAKPTNFGKSKMMSNIERMGGSRGA